MPRGSPPRRNYKLKEEENGQWMTSKMYRQQFPKWLLLKPRPKRSPTWQQRKRQQQRMIARSYRQYLNPLTTRKFQLLKRLYP
jgi:hypothetical protein